ncbi:hypothetical protein Acr_00g0049590 [Actinidia rufa]|uniref:At4g15545-like C-terminal domain-containing protein n=1 Tax=Actinidia rufa TaxID=165716 RepID=A0A7J0DKB0_9ERIC|nr:hypothetical protein Acr_00g0049590 [Actinidia rufa]
MSQSGGSGPDFHLPDEILAVIPTNPYDQLDLARKITSMAIASRVSKLESEVGMLKQQMSEKDHQIMELEDKASHLEQAYHEADLRLKIIRDDNMKLSKERDSLALTARKLGRNLAKVTFFMPFIVKIFSPVVQLSGKAVHFSYPKPHSLSSIANNANGVIYSKHPPTRSERERVMRTFNEKKMGCISEVGDNRTEGQSDNCQYYPSPVETLQGWTFSVESNDLCLDSSRASPCGKEDDLLLAYSDTLGPRCDNIVSWTLLGFLSIRIRDLTLGQAETVDIVTYDQSVPKSYPVTDEDTNGHSAHRSFSSTESGYLTDDASKQAGQRFSRTPYITPRLTPTGTPKIVSTTGSPIRYSAAVSPQETSRTTSPTKTQYEGRSALSSWYPSSQQSSAANSPPRGHPVPARTLRIDGKEFFRQARSRLSYEQFSAFLSNIKELNAQKQSREETLRKAEEIFGLDNRDLYLSFQGLLNRNIH